MTMLKKLDELKVITPIVQPRAAKLQVERLRALQSNASPPAVAQPRPR